MKRIARKTKATVALGVGLIAALGLAIGPLAAQVVISAGGRIESTVGGFVFPDGTAQATAVAAELAPVEDTGQQFCWNATGASISCSDTGQDGELQRGVDRPTPRFVNNLDGTVTDNLTGLIWLENANCFGTSTWTQALADANGLMDGQCSLTDGSLATDWRLPNINEILSLLDYSQSNPVLPPGHPFDSVQSATPYWSSSSCLPTQLAAWVVYMSDGHTSNSDSKGNSRSVWPVRGGQ